MTIVTTRDDAELQVSVAGDGRDVVLISGLGGTANFWMPIVNAFGGSFRSIRFDQRGIGGSERGTLPVTVRALAEDTWEVIDALEVDRPILWGHSTGGAIVQEMALLRPNLASGLVLSGSWAGPDRFMEHAFQLRLELLATAPERYAKLSAMLGMPARWLRDHPDVLLKSPQQAPKGSQIAVVRERIHALLAHDCRDVIGEIALPTLVLGAEDDMIVPPYLQEEMASLFGDAELHIFDRGGHFFPVTRPTETVAIYQSWISGRSFKA
jgi:pimeloyl-ACP methyl ester carboxylesterase